MQARVEAFIVEQHVTAGRSLRELSELTDRSFSAVRNILDSAGCAAGVPVLGRSAERPTDPS